MTNVEQTKRQSLWKSGGFAVLAFAVVALALSVPLLIRPYLFQPFSIPAGSMVPTLLIGDYIFVSKWSVGLARGDVVAFRTPKDNSTVYIKRVVGLPGDRIQMRQGLLHINGVAVTRERLPDFVGDEDSCGSAPAVPTKRWRDTLPNGVSYETLDCVEASFLDDTPVFEVPEGRFFMLGDNRDNSADSRMLTAMGYVPLENIIGRAGMIFFSAGGESGGIRWERIGMLVK